MNSYLEVWRRYAEFSGRSRRREYWMFQLFNTLIICAVMMLFVIFNGTTMITAALMACLVLYGVAIIVPHIAVMVRRLHDTNRSGWWFFISLVPLIGGIWFLVLMCTDSTPGENNYGPNPKGVG